jgi:hypothetical protein
MATANKSNYQPTTYETELIIPQFDTETLLNAYTPARAGALAQVGTDTYKYDGTSWAKFADASNQGGSTYRGEIPEL